MSWQEAVDTDIQAAAFIVSSDSDIKKMCSRMNREEDGRSELSVKDFKEYMRELRKKFTGKEDL